MKHQMKLVTANDPVLFEERLARTLSSLPTEAVIAEVAFDTVVTSGGTIQYSALLHVQATESWS